jgi:hypothetical protein
MPRVHIVLRDVVIERLNALSEKMGEPRSTVTRLALQAGMTVLENGWDCSTKTPVVYRLVGCQRRANYPTTFSKFEEPGARSWRAH